jgi:2-succinyl-5-enolpyruvyl-6-hydroxy-3-cyclohexene-1-carboxylate synthase
VRTTPEEDDVKTVLKEIKSGSKGVIVVGPGNFHNDNLSDELSQVSKLLGWPILADPLSNLRNEKAPFGLVRCYESLLRNKSFRESNLPEWVIHLGGVPTSKELNSFCENARKIILDEAIGEWRDPALSLSKMIYGEFKISLSIISQALRTFRAPLNWLDSWRDADNKAFKATDLVMEGISQAFEGKLFHRLSKILKPSSPLTVVIGNSMPVRDLDAFFLHGNKNVELVANKGANGIDGLVSTAMGISALEQNVLLILGDISFYHDMNGLLASKLHDLNATIIIVNNRGGGIFSFLPQRSSLTEQTYENFFGMPHDLDFSGVKTIYGGKFYRVASWADFDRVFSAAQKAKGLKIIEFLALDRDTNLALHRSTFQEISSRVM